MNVREERITIIGGGNGALAFAAFFGLSGRETRLWEFPEFQRQLDWIYQHQQIQATGKLEGTCRIQCLESLEKALEGATIIMVVVPAFVHRRVAEEISAFLEEDSIVVINPGRTGGALEVAAALDKRGKHNPVVEVQSLLFACRRCGEKEIHFNGIKNSLRVGVFPAKMTRQVMARLNPILPQFCAAPDILTTSFGNIGAVFHPAGAIQNIGLIESGRSFDFYTDAMTPGVVKIIEAIDRERMKIAEAAGSDTFSAGTWLYEAYQIKAGSLYESLQNNPAYRGISGPADIRTRYITEDVPTGLVPMEAFAQLFGVSTPTISAIISLANGLIGEDYRRSGRNLEYLGIDGKTLPEIRSLIQNGFHRKNP